MIDEKILKELKEMNKKLLSIKTFTIAQAQLTKNINMELLKMNRKTFIVKSKNWFFRLIDFLRRKK